RCHVLAMDKRITFGPLTNLCLVDHKTEQPQVLRGFRQNCLNSDGHLITEDSVFPTTAPGGAPKRNRCYQDARYFISSPPCARFARALGAPRTAHYAPPPLGAGAV